MVNKIVYTDGVKKLLNNPINEDLYNKLCPVSSQPGVLYGPLKSYWWLLAFQPILSANGTPTYNIANFVILIIKDLTSNEYSVKHSFDVVK